MKRYFTLILFLITLWSAHINSQQLKLNELDYFESPGVNVLVYNNRYNPIFFDEKTAGIELIHHGVRTVTGGAVRLHNTPEQWDLVPSIVSRNIDKKKQIITTVLRYEDFDFNSKIKVVPQGKGFLIQVILDKPVPDELVGRAGLNIEFLPPAYWESVYIADGKPKFFPRYPSSDTYVRPISEKIQQIYNHTTFDDRGKNEFLEAIPLSTAKTIILAPDNPSRHITIKSDADLMFFDGRILAQNGWYVVRSLLPSEQIGKVLEWYIEPNAISNWVREPVIGFSQVGYTPIQEKIAVIELDKNDIPRNSATLYQVTAEGKEIPKFTAKTKVWGRYLRYNYLTFDFTSINEPGVY